MEIYCLKCRTKTKSLNLQKVVSNNRVQLKAVCSDCNSKKCRYVTKAFMIDDESE